MKKWGDIIRNLTMLSVWTVLYHSIASVPFDLLVADGPSGNRGMGISSRLLFWSGRILYSSI